LANILNIRVYSVAKLTDFYDNSLITLVKTPSMITAANFALINTEIQENINEVFDSIRINRTEDYILFLADAEYKAKYENNSQGLSPFVIDNREDKYQDETRLNFLVQFLQNFYLFPENQDVDNSEIRLNMEMMIYSHVWEAKPFLKKLFRLAHISNNEPYQWDVSVPPMGKHDFIRQQIRDIFRANNFQIAEVIRSGFHTSLRNAFAHSEYAFDNQNGRIWLDNYGGQAWELRDISFDDWSRRFCYSVLLNYHLLNITHQRRTNINTEFKTDTYTISHPSNVRGVRRVDILYHEAHDSFSFAR